MGAGIGNGFSRGNPIPAIDDTAMPEGIATPGNIAVLIKVGSTTINPEAREGEATQANPVHIMSDF
jgi:hypothetical protein